MKNEVIVSSKKCPICLRPTIYAYSVTEEKDDFNKGTGMFYKCSCGVIFQEAYPKEKPYDDEHVNNVVAVKEFEDRSIHAQRTYITLLEELTYGRKLLDVGYCYEKPLNWLRNRGWICWGIDKHHLVKEDLYHIKGNFEDYDFRDKEFDVIWMGHVFEHFKDPIGALKKAYVLMPDDGVVVITTPDVDFIHQTSPVRFPHWKHNEHYTLWNKRALKREAKKLGFQVIMCRSNFSERFMDLWDVHVILQKIYV